MYHGILRKDDADRLPACNYCGAVGEGACDSPIERAKCGNRDAHPSACPRCKDYVGKCGHCGRKL